MKDYRLYIAGKWVPSASGRVEDDLNPFSGEIYARVSWAGPADAEAALAAAYDARLAWRRTLAAEREAILLAAARIAEGRSAELADVLVSEGGSTMGKAMFEAHALVNLLRSAAGECRRIRGETIPSDEPGQISITMRQSLGVVVAIAPFNFPLLLSAKKVALALAAGNTVILKPAEETPVSGLKLAEIFDEAGLPPGVLNVLPGDGEELGPILVPDPRVRLIDFTGSTTVGKLLAVEAARGLKKFTLELGGKSPLIVLGDAEVDYAVNAACFGMFLHQGQICMASSRIIVEAPLFETFCRRFTTKVESLKVGDPREPDTVIGPLIRPGQCDVLDTHVNDAVAQGARVLCGGTREGPFYRPTVLADVTPDMRVYHEESFGPVVTILRADDDAHALRLANDTAYGLSAAVITNDMGRAFTLGMDLEAGMVHLNSSTCHDAPHVPFGGVKNSGFGREGGHYSMDAMTEIKWLTIQVGESQFPF